MDITTIALVTAANALVSAVAGPVTSYLVASRQIRASVISNNRERWIEALRDTIAEYVALLLTASMVREASAQDSAKLVSADHDLIQVVERLVLVKNKVLLLTNPDERRSERLCDLVERSYQSLTSETPPSLATIRKEAMAITQAGRDVLRAEWARVKRGE